MSGTVAYPEMWRVHQPDGWISDMARLEWAKEGAIRTVLAELNRKENVGAGLKPIGMKNPSRGLPPPQKGRQQHDADHRKQTEA